MEGGFGDNIARDSAREYGVKWTCGKPERRNVRTDVVVTMRMVVRIGIYALGQVKNRMTTAASLFCYGTHNLSQPRQRRHKCLGTFSQPVNIIQYQYQLCAFAILA
jgi:hypothetical protein